MMWYNRPGPSILTLSKPLKIKKLTQNITYVVEKKDKHFPLFAASFLHGYGYFILNH